MTAFALNDDQRRAAERLSGRVIISAGAGSGKTRVLTERTANAIAGLPSHGWRGVGVEDILAITFTEKAAGELAERVRGALRAAGRADDARKVDSAWISTIHGMCSRILRASALEAGIDPGFSVLDTVESAALRQQAFDEVAREALDTDAEALRLFSLYGFESVADASMSLADALRGAGPAALDLKPTDRAPVRQLLSDAKRFFALKAMDLGSEEGAAAAFHCTNCSATADRLEELGKDGLSDAELAEAAWRVIEGHHVGNRSAGVKEHVGEIKGTRKELGSRAAALVLVGVLEALLRLTDAYLDRWADLKRTRGGLDFDDLQIETLRFLQGDHAADWAGRFSLTMVDEFQDTDVLQLGLVERLSSENLCTVGDERQSIYGFRGADVSVYREHRESMIAQGAADITLSQNYRSHEQLLRFVNQVFRAPEMFGEELVPLRHGRVEQSPALIDEGVPRVDVLFADKADRPRPVLADAIARRLARLKSEQGVPAAGMVILLRSYIHAGAYAAALEAHGLDAVIVGGSRFFDRPEIAAARGFVRLISNCRDEEALGHVLCSDLCRFSDDGLLGLRRAVMEGRSAGLWEALTAADLGRADRIRADRLVDAVDGARGRLGRLPLAEVILRAVEETGMDARLLASGLEGGQAYANLLKFARMAASFEANGHGGPAAFASYLDAKQEFGDHEPPAPLVRDGSDAVQIMSIHASKGLEFPVVAVPELDSSGRGERCFALWDLGTRSISATLPRGWSSDDDMRRTSGFKEMRAAAKAREAAEVKRLLYVAFTRAEDALILAGGAALKEGSRDNSIFRLVLDALGVQPLGGLDVLLGADGEPLCRVTDVGAEYASDADDAEPAKMPTEGEQLAWLDAIRADTAEEPPAALTVPDRFSYSALKSFERCPRRYHFERRLQLGSRHPIGSKATDFGSAFHAVTELFAEDEPLDVERVSAIARYHGLGADGAGRLIAAFEAYRASETAQRLRQLPTVRRETAFAIHVGGADGFLLDGSIDVYAADGDRALIVDYKTGKAGVSIEEAGHTYELQARCYALAAARDGRASVDVVFVRPEAGSEVVEFNFGPRDAEVTERRLLELRSRIFAGEAGAAYPAGSDACFGCPASADCPH